MIEELKERGIGFRSISDGMIDTTSESGELVLNIFSQYNFRDLPGNTRWQHVFGVSLLSQ